MQLDKSEPQGRYLKCMMLGVLVGHPMRHAMGDSAGASRGMDRRDSRGSAIERHESGRMSSCTYVDFFSVGSLGDATKGHAEVR